MEERLNLIESKLDKLYDKFAPLVDILSIIINENLDKTNSQSCNVEHELAYKIVNDSILIYGSKTYNNKDIIKSKFNANWNKEKTSWEFKTFENCEEALKEIFPDIIKDQ